MKKVMVIVLFALAFMASGCETVKGFGKDIQSAGKALEKKADD